MSEIAITVNGEPRLSQADTLAALLAELGYVGKRVAVEINGRIVPRSFYAETTLIAGAQIEIVVAVGGG